MCPKKSHRHWFADHYNNDSMHQSVTDIHTHTQTKTHTEIGGKSSMKLI